MTDHRPGHDVQHLFLLARPGPEARREAASYLRDIGVRVTAIHGDAALVGTATGRHIELAAATGLFSAISRGPIGREAMASLAESAPVQREVAELWNFQHSERYRKLGLDDSKRDITWGDGRVDPHGPDTPFAADDFKAAVCDYYRTTEDEFLARDFEQVPKELVARVRRKPDAKAFLELEEALRARYEDETVAYHLARLTLALEPKWLPAVFDLAQEFVVLFFLLEAACWKMEGEIAVGVVFVQSSKAGGPKFSTTERNTLKARVFDGLQWLAQEAPTAAHLTWVFDWQYVKVDVANGTNSSSEDYWRNPAMGQVAFQGNTYSANWSGVGDYRDDLRIHFLSAHALVIFVTPYGNSWHAYASGGRITLAERNNWGNWGIGTVDEITAHEMCHLFGAADEYTGSGTPCSSCGGQFGCYKLPNGNCGSCAEPHQSCIMDQNTRRLCAYTQGHIGWADLFVELHTTDTSLAGTDDTVWLDTGDRTFVLDNPTHNDREQGNVEGYALNYTGMTKNQLKRVGIRKSSDGWFGGWKLERVKVWVKGEPVCNAYANQWLEDEYRWWASLSCGSSSTIVNRLRVRVTTANVTWAGTDDDVTLYLGGRSRDLDNPWHNDFEKGNTDTFDLDPGTGLYKNMLSQIRIHKSPDGFAGGWKLKGLEIIVNGSTVYNKQNINKWMEDSDRDWYGTM
jgi:hypothetical protein